MKYTLYTLILLIFCLCLPIKAHDVLLEIKGSAFLPTSTVFKNIYGTCGNFGGEITVGNIFDHLYAFGSIDFSVKHGHTLELSNPTKMTFVNFGLGLKYFIPFTYGDVYIGLGVQPVHLTTLDYISADSFSLEHQWSCGGITKTGVIFNLPHALFIDLFFDYSFVKFTNFNDTTVQTPINGGLLGVGFGYRFN